MTAFAMRRTTYPFQSAPSLRRATHCGRGRLQRRQVSIRALPAEGDSRRRVRFPGSQGFNPRPPCGGRPGRLGQGRRRVRVSIRALPAEGDASRPIRPILDHHVSIRALPAEGDPSASRTSLAPRRFNPRPPCGGRPKANQAIQDDSQFQSAPSLRRATPENGRPSRRFSVSIRALPAEGDPGAARGPTSGISCFNPRPPCGGRPWQPHLDQPMRAVSIRALPAEGDPEWCRISMLVMLFQSAPSLRRATQ